MLNYSDLTVENLVGMNINKEFMPSVANTIGTNLARYKVIHKDQFACNLMHVGRDKSVVVSKYPLEKPSIISPAYKIFQVKDTSIILPDFLMLYFLKSEFDRLGWFYTDSSIRGSLDWSKFCNIEIPVPDIDVQKKIVDVCQFFNELIALKERINNNLDTIESTLFNEWFINRSFFAEEPKKETELGLIPDSWNVINLGGVGLDISDGNYSSKYPKSTEFVKEGVPFIRGKDFSNKTIDLRNAVFITPEKHSELKKGHTKKGDLIMTSRGEIGQIAYLPDNLIDVNINSQLIRLNGNGVLPRSYLAGFLFSNFVKNIIKGLTSGTALQQLTISKLSLIPFLLPPNEILEKYDKIVSPIREMILKNQDEIWRLQHLKDTLLPKLLSGEIDIFVINCVL